MKSPDYAGLDPARHLTGFIGRLDVPLAPQVRWPACTAGRLAPQVRSVEIDDLDRFDGLIAGGAATPATPTAPKPWTPG